MTVGEAVEVPKAPGRLIFPFGRGGMSMAGLSGGGGGEEEEDEVEEEDVLEGGVGAGAGA